METTCVFTRTRWMEERGQKLPAQSGQRPGTGAQDRWVGLAPQALTRRRASALLATAKEAAQAEEFTTRKRDGS